MVLKNLRKGEAGMGVDEAYQVKDQFAGGGRIGDGVIVSFIACGDCIPPWRVVKFGEANARGRLGSSW